MSGFDKKELRKAIESDHRRKARETIRALRAAIKTALADVKAERALLRERCKALRTMVRKKIKDMRDRARVGLARIAQRERQKAHATLIEMKRQAREQWTARIDRARAALAAERQYQRELANIERSNRQRAKEHVHASYLERRGESDDLVRQNIPEDLHALYAQVKRTLKPTKGLSKTEAFLQWVHDHPDEVLEIQEHRAIRELKRLQAEHAKEERAARQRPRREPLSAIPF